MSDDPSVAIIERRAKRAAATVLGFKDRECSIYLPDEVDDKFRKIILDQINELAHLAVDCINSVSDVNLTNQMYVDLLQEIRDEVRNGNSNQGSG